MLYGFDPMACITMIANQENHGSLFRKILLYFGSCSDFSAPGRWNSKAMDVLDMLDWIVYRVHLLGWEICLETPSSENWGPFG